MTSPGQVTQMKAWHVTILSIFPGVDLFGKSFTKAGFCVVTGPDLILADDIRDFHPHPGVFNGVIGGSPCQDFSSLNRNPGTYSREMLEEFIRIVELSKPDWWLLENVAGVPDIEIDGYGWQRFSLDLDWFSDYSRLRHFQFGHKDGLMLDVMKGKKGEIRGTAALANDNRSFAELCAIQRLPENFDLPSFNVDGKKKAVGNGVPLQMGKYLASVISSQIYGCDSAASNKCDVPAEENRAGPRVDICDAAPSKRCDCKCGRKVYGRADYAGSACRKRAQRRREK